MYPLFEIWKDSCKIVLCRSFDFPYLLVSPSSFPLRHFGSCSAKLRCDESIQSSSFLSITWITLRQTYHSFNFSVFFGNVLTVAQKPRTFPNNQQSFIVFCSAGIARQFDGITLLFLCSS
ncbi:uncharacterized protein LOC143304124 isoform X1 [Bombus vancouverensis nearcticus]|uniref:uncharacterized protein LOC143304124 isoform X1 n=1 Tax=Bombus vancouverensis nearcticus TaxID=2705178 RepID=UPI00402B6435